VRWHAYSYSNYPTYGNADRDPGDTDAHAHVRARLANGTVDAERQGLLIRGNGQ
jgi:hypothetical protein